LGEVEKRLAPAAPHPATRGRRFSIRDGRASGLHTVAAADAQAQSLSLVVAALGRNETAPLEIFVA
jgi:hypothetical protein